MKAYKFRSSSQLSFALDAIFNNRLYCADWRKLNDPMEGMFEYFYSVTCETDHFHNVDRIVDQKDWLRVCSLSLTFNSYLLWAHYASGFDGLALEVDLPDDSNHIRKVGYRQASSYIIKDDPQDLDLAQVAKDILSSKYQEWEYEKEIRILNEENWYPLTTQIKHVIAGHCMNPAIFKGLRIICHQKNITLSQTSIGDNGIDADNVNPLRDNEI